MPTSTPTLSRGLSREERKMQRIMEQFRAMEEREQRKKERAKTPRTGAKKKVKKKATSTTKKRKLTKSQKEETPKKKRLKKEEKTPAIQVKKKKKKTTTTTKKKKSVIEVKKKATLLTPPVKLQKKPRPPPRDRSAPQKSNSDDEEPKEKVVLMSDDTKHLPKKRYILLVDREIGRSPSFPFKKRWKHQGSLELHEKVNALLETADNILGKVSHKDTDAKSIVDPKAKSLLVTGPISTSPAVAAFRSNSNPPPLHLA